MIDKEIFYGVELHSKNMELNETLTKGIKSSNAVDLLIMEFDTYDESCSIFIKSLTYQNATYCNMHNISSNRVLNLGCGYDYISPNCTNVDINISSKADIICDLNIFPWPFPDETFNYIHCYDIIEHIDNVIKFMEESWRILEKNGRMMIRTVNADHPQSFSDPTHKHFFTNGTFDIFDLSTFAGKRYGWYTNRKFKILYKTKVGCILVFLLEKIGEK